MSHFLNQAVQIAFSSLVIVSPACLALEQTAGHADKQLTPHNKPIAEKASSTALCESPVQPIKRTRKPAKPVEVDWTAMPSTYTHDQSGQRVDQYALPVEPPSSERPDFVRSGFRHTRSSLQAGSSADHYHVTEQWGQPVRPYGEWRYPNRPFSVPYDQWGPQLPQVVVGGNQWNAYGLPGNNQGGMPGQGNGSTGTGSFGPGNPNGMNPHGGNWNGGNQHGIQGHGYPNPAGAGQFGGFGVGPNNALQADEYYPPAPIYHSMPEGGFQSPFRN